MIELLALGALILAAGFGPDLVQKAFAKRPSPSILTPDTENDEAFVPLSEQYNAADGVDVVMVGLRRAIGSRNFEEARGLLEIAIKLKGPASE